MMVTHDSHNSFFLTTDFIDFEIEKLINEDLTHIYSPHELHTKHGIIVEILTILTCHTLEHLCGCLCSISRVYTCSSKKVIFLLLFLHQRLCDISKNLVVYRKYRCKKGIRIRRNPELQTATDNRDSRMSFCLMISISICSSYATKNEDSRMSFYLKMSVALYLILHHFWKISH